MKNHSYYKSFLHNVFKNIFCLTLFAGISAVAVAQDDACCTYNPFQYSRVELGYSWGDFIAIDNDYAEFGLFVPFYLTKYCTFFVDARAYDFMECRDEAGDCGNGRDHDHNWATSIGIGMRKVICNGDIVGANVYYDSFEGDRDKWFHRVGVGLEYLSACFDARINGYFRVGNRTHEVGDVQTFTDVVFGETIITQSQPTQVSFSSGFDAEIGKTLFCCDTFNIYGAIGPYFFDLDSDADDDLWGAFARLEANIGEYVTLRVRTSYDKIYDSRTQFSAMLNLPLDILCCWKTCKDCCLNLLTQPVRRNGIIFTNDCCRYSRIN